MTLYVLNLYLITLSLSLSFFSLFFPLYIHMSPLIFSLSSLHPYYTLISPLLHPYTASYTLPIILYTLSLSSFSFLPIYTLPFTLTLSSLPHPIYTLPYTFPMPPPPSCVCYYAILPYTLLHPFTPSLTLVHLS